MATNSTKALTFLFTLLFRDDPRYTSVNMALISGMIDNRARILKFNG